MFEKSRKRRVIYNDDGDQQFQEAVDPYGYTITDEQSFVDARTTPVFDTHVDTYVWCLGNGCYPPWGGSHTILPCLGSSNHATDLIVDACHSRGLEVWGSLRMNDIHDSFRATSLDKTYDPLKGKHPEYLISPEDNRRLPPTLVERYLWTAFNFARPEVRRHRLNFIKRSASAHDFDGYELDFTRFVWNFMLGDERAHANEMTELIREARACLNTIGRGRKRPYTFAVHVMDSVETSLELGLDVVTWLAEELVDVLVVGMGYVPYVLRLDQWLELGERYGVQVYPSVNTNTYTSWWKERFERPSAWHDAIRASSAYFWQEGADGLYLFNLFCQEDKRVGPMPRRVVYAPLGEIGDPGSLVGRNKLYSIQPANQSGFCSHGSEATPLPIALDRVEHKLPLKVGPDADDPNARFTLTIWSTSCGGWGNTRIWLRLNHTLLSEPVRNGGLLQVDVPPGVLRKGHNELSIWCNTDVTQAEHPIIVHQVFMSALYRDGGCMR